MNGKVLDIAGAKTSAGAKVIMYGKKDSGDADNQLWFEDRYGNIRSKLNPFLVLDGSGKFYIWESFPSSELLTSLTTVSEYMQTAKAVIMN